MHSCLLALVLAVVVAPPLRAQDWQGRVLEVGSAVPVSGAAVCGLDGHLLARAGADGVFRVISPPAKILVTADGYVTATAHSGRDALYLLRDAFSLDPVRVQGRRVGEPGNSAVAGPDVQRVAGALGDSLRVVETLPGVTTANDSSGLISIQGGAPEDNRFYIDGIPWVMPNHFGLLATVDPGFLESVDLHSAGFPARYGDATGAIVEARTRAAGPQFVGSADLSLLKAGLNLEGPLGGLGDWTASAHRSYWDIGGGPGYYFDGEASARVNLGPHNWLRLLTLYSDDEDANTLAAGQPAGPYADGLWQASIVAKTAGAVWEMELGPIRSHLTAYGYDLDQLSREGSGFYDDLDLKDLGLREDAEWTLPWNQVLGGGGGWDRLRGDYAFRDYVQTLDYGGTFATVGILRQLAGTAWQSADNAYLQDSWRPGGGVELTLGLRYDHNQAETGSAAVQEALQPRLSVQWEPRTGTALRLAWGRYAQAPSPQELSAAAGNPHLGPVLGEHMVAGLEQGWGPSFSGRFEAYHKAWDGIVVSAAPPTLYTNEGSGQAEGADLYLRYDDHRRWLAWLSLALSRSERLDGPGQDWHLYQYDEPWVACLVASRKLTRHFTLGSTATYHSGSLFTPIYARADSTAWYPDWYTGQPFSQRVADYFRWDMRGDYTWYFHRGSLDVYLDFLNLTGNVNPMGRAYSSDYKTYTDLPQQGSFPEMGILGTF